MTTPNIPPRWYVLNADGLATLCADQANAVEAARQADIAWPNLAPHVAVKLAPVQPAMPADEWLSELGSLVLSYRYRVALHGEYSEAARQSYAAIIAHARRRIEGE